MQQTAGPGQQFRQFIDRTINPNNPNSLTNVYNIPNCTSVMMIALHSVAGVGTVTYRLEGSDDNVTWFPMQGTSTMTVTGTTASSLNVNNVLGFALVRVQCTVNTSGATLAYMQIKAWRV
jgi:hypothetical protein